MACRLWGVLRSLACPFGCVPPGGLLEDADGLDLLAASLHAGGAPAEFEGVQPGIGQQLREEPQLGRAVSSYLQHHGRQP